MAAVLSDESRTASGHHDGTFTEKDERLWYTKDFFGRPKDICKEALGYAVMSELRAQGILTDTPSLIIEAADERSETRPLTLPAATADSVRKAPPSPASVTATPTTPKAAKPMPPSALSLALGMKLDLSIALRACTNHFRTLSEVLGENPESGKAFCEHAASEATPVHHIRQLGAALTLKTLLGDDDNKPANIVITTKDGEEIAYPVDFECIFSVGTPTRTELQTVEQLLQHIHSRGKTPEDTPHLSTFTEMVDPSEIISTVDGFINVNTERVTEAYHAALDGLDIDHETKESVLGEFHERRAHLSRELERGEHTAGAAGASAPSPALTIEETRALAAATAVKTPPASPSRC